MKRGAKRRGLNRRFTGLCVCDDISLRIFINVTFQDARQSQVTEIGRKTTSALGSQNTKQDQGAIKFGKIKSLVLRKARQGQVTKNCRKTTSALEPQNKL